MNYAGIDLHSNNSYVVVANQEGRRLFERRLPNDLEVILSRLSDYDPIESVALESTYNATSLPCQVTSSSPVRML